MGQKANEYKVFLKLLPLTWAKLRAEAATRRVTGREVIEGLLTQWATQQPTPTTTPEPLPDPPADELDSWTDVGR